MGRGDGRGGAFNPRPFQMTSKPNSSLNSVMKFGV